LPSVRWMPYFSEYYFIFSSLFSKKRII
jgi:hypothetical protein